MVAAGISANGPTKAIFVEPGAKINAEYYINNVLKQYLKEAERLYPDGNFVFHQDSAPSHSAKKTLNFLQGKKIIFIKPRQWMPNSPDCAPCDYFLWGYLKRALNRRKVRTIQGLKKCISEELKKVPQIFINRALKSWPRRCRQIYYNKGLQIENYK